MGFLFPDNDDHLGKYDDPDPVECARCLGPSVRFHPLCRDGHNVGPLIWICERCWSLPSEVIWVSIAQVSSHPGAFRPVHSITTLLPSVEEVRATR